MGFSQRSTHCGTIGLRTCRAHDDVELFVASVNRLDSGRCTSLDGGRNEVNLMSFFISPILREGA
jgi:hypothetical protein